MCDFLGLLHCFLYICVVTNKHVGGGGHIVAALLVIHFLCFSDTVVDRERQDGFW